MKFLEPSFYTVRLPLRINAIHFNITYSCVIIYKYKGGIFFVFPINRDIHFKERIRQLVSATSVSIYDLEILYIETFNLDTSPLIHCTRTKKGIVLSNIPGEQVRSVVDEPPILGRAIVMTVLKK